MVSSSVSFSCFQSQFLLQYNFTAILAHTIENVFMSYFLGEKLRNCRARSFLPSLKSVELFSKVFFLNKIILSLDTDMTSPLCSWPHKRKNYICVKVTLTLFNFSASSWAHITPICIFSDAQSPFLLLFIMFYFTTTCGQFWHLV